MRRPFVLLASALIFAQLVDSTVVPGKRSLPKYGTASGKSPVQKYANGRPDREIQLPLRSAVVGDRMAVVDATGERVKLACVNWYGAHLKDMGRYTSVDELYNITEESGNYRCIASHN